MRLRIKEKVKEKHPIELGDLFMSISNGAAYIFTLVGDGRCNLICMNGINLWSEYSNTDDARRSISVDVYKGELRHYPASLYELILQPKEEK